MPVLHATLSIGSHKGWCWSGFSEWKVCMIAVCVCCIFFTRLEINSSFPARLLSSPSGFTSNTMQSLPLISAVVRRSTRLISERRIPSTSEFIAFKSQMNVSTLQKINIGLSEESDVAICPNEKKTGAEWAPVEGGVKWCMSDLVSHTSLSGDSLHSHFSGVRGPPCLPSESPLQSMWRTRVFQPPHFFLQNRKLPFNL